MQSEEPESQVRDNLEFPCPEGFGTIPHLASDHAIKYISVELESKANLFGYSSAGLSFRLEHDKASRSEGGMMRLETLIELK